MPIAPLISIDRFLTAVGGSLDDAERSKAEIIIDDVSALVRAYCGRDFELHEQETITVHGGGSLIRLPAYVHPIITIHSVTADGRDAPYRREGQVIYLTDRYYLDTAEVVVTYGYPTVPGDVAAVALAESLYRYNLEPGVSQEQIGDLVTDYSMYQPTLSRDARRGLRRYRQSVRVVSL